MTAYVETKIGLIDDPDFQSLIDELCECANWAKDDFENKTLANFFTAVVIEKKEITRLKVLIDPILRKKVKDLEVDSVVYGVCCELLSRAGKSMDDYLGKSVYAVVKQCHKAVCPKPSRPRKPTRRELEHQAKTKRILSRR